MAGLNALPTGRQIELAHGGQRATVVEVGGGLRTYTAGDRAIIAGFGEREMCHGARGQVLMPWPNRISDGRYTFAGTEYQLSISEPARTTAIHGLVRWDAWKIVTAADDRARLTHRVHPQPGYPFTLDLSVEYALTLDGLTVIAHATNVGPDPCPFGAGFHPYLAPDTTTVDGTVLALPARQPPDFLVPRPVGDAVLDTCFTDLHRDDAGIARVQFGETTLWVDGAFDFLMVFSADTLGADERRRSLAVEPMTCAPDAFNTGAGLLVLAPGQTWGGTWGINPP